MLLKRFTLGLLTLALTLALTATAQDNRHLSVIHTFSATTTGNPESALIQDSAGNFYGTTFWGGRLAKCGGDGCGAVYRLSPNEGGGWTYTVLYEFAGYGQGTEATQLVIDSAGNLYGEFSANGADGAGAIFELSPTTSGPWKFTNLYTFSGESNGEFPNGEYPVGGLTLDASGNLYGVTAYGGTVNGGVGTMFELSPDGSGGWMFSSQYSFDDIWAHPNGPLIFDADGNAYGTSAEIDGGSGGVFELSPGAGGWTLTSLYRFTGGSDGGLPDSGLTRDALGNLYGTNIEGGLPRGQGVVYELSPNVGGGYTFGVLHSFTGGSGGGPSYSPVIMDSSGNLYGSTNSSATGWGMVFELSPSDSGWNYGLVHMFTGGPDGGFPGSLTFDSTGNIWGAAAYGAQAGCVNNSGCGTVFELLAPAPVGRN
jgi:hypothetical protein